MWGRTAAYFITVKDEKNKEQTAARNFKQPLSYIELVAHFPPGRQRGLRIFSRPDHWYVGAGQTRTKNCVMTNDIFHPILGSSNKHASSPERPSSLR
jgi:hypothetical protein